MSTDYNKDPVNTTTALPNDTNASLASTAIPKITDHSGDYKLPAPDSNNKMVNQSAALAAVNKPGQGGHLELLEERAVVNKERLDVGKVIVTKHSRTKTIEVPIELVEEYITIQTEYYDAESQDLLSGNYDDKDILRHVEPSLDSNAVVTINGKQVAIGDTPVEIVLSRQVATVTKETYVIQEVDVNKTTHIHTDSIQVELKHEELDVIEEGFLEHETAHVDKK